MLQARIAILLVLIFLCLACRSEPPVPTSVPTETPTKLPTPTSIPVPTETPIPGYLEGEEEAAYPSFLGYYQEKASYCHSNPDEYIQAQVDEEYPGKAIYVGDGIWRFYIQVFTRYVHAIGGGEFYFEEWDSKEEILDVRSLSDRTWEYSCTWHESSWYDPNDEPQYEPHYEPDYRTDYEPDYSEEELNYSLEPEPEN